MTDDDELTAAYMGGYYDAKKLYEDEIERLRDALRPFAKCSEVYPKAISSWPASFAGVNDMDCPLTIGDFHRARTALGEKER